MLRTLHLTDLSRLAQYVHRSCLLGFQNPFVAAGSEVSNVAETEA